MDIIHKPSYTSYIMTKKTSYFLILRDSVEKSTMEQIVRPLMPINGAFSLNVSLMICELILSFNARE